MAGRTDGDAGPDGGARRELSVAVSVEASITSPLMTVPAKRLLSLLGVLPDGAAVDDLDELRPGEGLAAAAVLRQVGLAYGESGRVRTLAPVRDYVAVKYPPEAADLKRVMSFYAQRTSAAGRRVGGIEDSQAAVRPRVGSGSIAAAVPSSGSVAVRRRRLAAELRRLRRQSGMTVEDVAGTVAWSKAKLTRYELGRSTLRPSEVETLLEHYAVRGKHREELLNLSQDVAQKDWWEEYSDVLTEERLALIGLEAEAASVLQWQINVIPALLQTEEYARKIFLGSNYVRVISPIMIERRVQTHLLRQRVLTRNQPLVLTAILDEAVLSRQIGDRAMMYAQLQHLASIAEMPNVTLKIMPLDKPNSLRVESFSILHFGSVSGTRLSDVVKTASLRSTLYFEGETDTKEFRLSFEYLAQESLGAEESRELILRAARPSRP